MLIPVLCIYLPGFAQVKGDTEIAVEVIKGFQEGKMENITVFFDENMKKALPEDKLKFVWDDLIRMCGDFEKYSEITTGRFESYDIVFILCHFKNFNLRMKTVFNGQHQVSGLFFIPPE